MPYKSLKQERYFNANKAKLEKQGVNVNEWNNASKGKSLPVKVHHSGKGTRARINTAAEKTFFGSKYSK
jgi:uncharacterized Fe-S center protein